jgi:hypothetical protein
LFFCRLGFRGPSICSVGAFFNSLSLDPEICYSGFVEQCVRSVDQQDYPNLQCIVLECASNDDSLSVIEKAFRDFVKSHEEDKATWEKTIEIADAARR